ncbi:MAG: EscU/YscU/HrcU family type III secretion system export apparatus switch protein [Bacillota bacterium]
MPEQRREIAAALRYNPEEHSAPVVVAAGRGDLAKKIKEIAREHNIPVYEDEALADALVKLGAQVEIPPELYQAVACVLAYVARLDQRVQATPFPRGRKGTSETGQERVNGLG